MNKTLVSLILYLTIGIVYLCPQKKRYHNRYKSTIVPSVLLNSNFND